MRLSTPAVDSMLVLSLGGCGSEDGTDTTGTALPSPPRTATAPGGQAAQTPTDQSGAVPVPLPAEGGWIGGSRSLPPR